MPLDNLKPAILVLEEGTVFHGFSFSQKSMACGEVIFNTSTTGYQEILTDPSYAHQLVAFTSPHIGNTGINPEDDESARSWLSGVIVKEISPISSSWRARESLQEFLTRRAIPCIFGIDTRRLTLLLREKGAQKGCMAIGDHSAEEALERARSCMPGQVLFSSHPYIWKEGRLARPDLKSPSVYVYDFGVKHSLLRCLVDAGCRVTVIPSSFPYQEILCLGAEGVVFSSGPGDPALEQHAIRNLQGLLQARLPLLGICLGCQLLGLACGAKTWKMKCGHHGTNHPVYDIQNQRVLTTSQNHSFALDEATLPWQLFVTHRSLFDETIEGIQHKEAPAIGFQAHPEAGPGPSDARAILTTFTQWMNDAAR